MSEARVIEIGDITIGIVLSDREGFRFFAAERCFASLDGKAFRTTAQIIQAAKHLMSKQNQSKHRPPNGAGLPANEASTWPGSSSHFPTVEKVVT